MYNSKRNYFIGCSQFPSQLEEISCKHRRLMFCFREKIDFIRFQSGTEKLRADRHNKTSNFSKDAAFEAKALVFCFADKRGVVTDTSVRLKKLKGPFAISCWFLFIERRKNARMLRNGSQDLRKIPAGNYSNLNTLWDRLDLEINLSKSTVKVTDS